MRASLGCELSIVMERCGSRQAAGPRIHQAANRSAFSADHSAPGVGQEHASMGLSSWRTPAWLWTQLASPFLLMMVSHAEIVKRCREDLMEVGFFFWPFTLELVEQMAERAERYGYAMIGIADTPANAMDPWVAAGLVARATRTVRVAISATNLVTRHPAVSAAAIASIDHICHGRGVLGIGAGHSGTRNLGLRSSTADELADGLRFIKTLLRGEPATIGAATAHLPWVKHAPPVFLAASHPRSLRAAGGGADGVFINYGLGADNIRQSRDLVLHAVEAGGRPADAVELWQVAALDCNEDGNRARQKIGAMLAFLAGYVIGDHDLGERGVPARYHDQLLELRRRYSTRPGEADVKLVAGLGLFDYLAQRLSICGTPAECLAQARAAKAAGADRLMLTVSLASDPVRTVELFGERVLPAVR
jgi:5,10-methylenetetrahydromethanopterin reductase